MQQQNSLNVHIILLAEDDPEDRFLTSRALEKNRSKHQLFTVENGRQLLDYLDGNNDYEDRGVIRCQA